MYEGRQDYNASLLLDVCALLLHVHRRDMYTYNIISIVRVCVCNVYISIIYGRGSLSRGTGDRVIYYFKHPTSRRSGNAVGICWAVSYKYNIYTFVRVWGDRRGRYAAREFPRPGKYMYLIYYYYNPRLFPTARMCYRIL